MDHKLVFMSIWDKLQRFLNIMLCKKNFSPNNSFFPKKSSFVTKFRLHMPKNWWLSYPLDSLYACIHDIEGSVALLLFPSCFMLCIFTLIWDVSNEAIKFNACNICKGTWKCPYSDLMTDKKVCSYYNCRLKIFR